MGLSFFGGLFQLINVLVAEAMGFRTMSVPLQIAEAVTLALAVYFRMSFIHRLACRSVPRGGENWQPRVLLRWIILALVILVIPLELLWRIGFAVK